MAVGNFRVVANADHRGHIPALNGTQTVSINEDSLCKSDEVGLLVDVIHIGHPHTKQTADKTVTMTTSSRAYIHT